MHKVHRVSWISRTSKRKDAFYLGKTAGFGKEIIASTVYYKKYISGAARQWNAGYLVKGKKTVNAKTKRTKSHYKDEGRSV